MSRLQNQLAAIFRRRTVRRRQSRNLSEVNRPTGMSGLGSQMGPQAGPVLRRRTVALILGGLLTGVLLGFMDVTLFATAGTIIISDLFCLSLFVWHSISSMLID